MTAYSLKHSALIIVADKAKNGLRVLPQGLRVAISQVLKGVT
jgi:hypothetical protein